MIRTYLTAIPILAAPGLAAYLITLALQTVWRVSIMPEYAQGAVAVDIAWTVTAVWMLAIAFVVIGCAVHDEMMRGVE